MNSLRKRWQAGAEIFNVPANISDSLFQNIVAAYGGVNRYYHTLSHLEFMFAEIDRQNINDVHIEFATWYHDFVYKPGNRLNESSSAKIARGALQRLGADQSITEKVANMIMATKTHSCDPGDKLTALFLDIDMSILGANGAVYKQYAHCVRQEAGWLPDFAYRRARLDFLKSLIKRESIFLTPQFQTAYERSARDNIESEIVKLTDVTE